MVIQLNQAQFGSICFVVAHSGPTSFDSNQSLSVHDKTVLNISCGCKNQRDEHVAF